MHNQGTAWRLPVDRGYYSQPDSAPASLRHYQSICPVGHYCISGERFLCPSGSFGSSLGLSTRTCSGPCNAGHYCESGSDNVTQFKCGGNHVYCPVGSSAPTLALPGQRTIGDSNETRNGTVHCPAGSYCVGGVAIVCPAGRFGCADGLGDADCNGPCAPGYFCPPGSTSNQMVACGNASVYCPVGSSGPQRVGTGNFSTSGPTPERHSEQLSCSPGSYCMAGVQVV